MLFRCSLLSITRWILLQASCAVYFYSLCPWHCVHASAWHPRSPPIRKAASLPASTPWNLEALSQPPAFEWSKGKPIRSLYFQGEAYRGRPRTGLNRCGSGIRPVMSVRPPCRCFLSTAARTSPTRRTVMPRPTHSFARRRIFILFRNCGMATDLTSPRCDLQCSGFP